MSLLKVLSAGRMPPLSCAVGMAYCIRKLQRRLPKGTYCSIQLANTRRPYDDVATDLHNANLLPSSAAIYCSISYAASRCMLKKGAHDVKATPILSYLPK